MEDENPPPPPPPQQPGQVKLAAFWSHAPALWFAQAECTFAVKRVVAQFDRYCHVVAALPHESIRLVADIVEGEPSETPYDDIRQRLVASHQLSDFQKAERLFQMPALGACKPSELMAAMLETCPRGEEKTNLFACIFLQRLPREIRVLLAKADHKDRSRSSGSQPGHLRRPTRRRRAGACSPPLRRHRRPSGAFSASSSRWRAQLEASRRSSTRRCITSGPPGRRPRGGFAAWIPPSWRRLRPNSPSWRKTASSGGPRVTGLLPFTWS
jgi:hypothetical protein